MKKILLFTFFLLWHSVSIAQQRAENMHLLSTWRDADQSLTYNDIWGYAANGREYAIIGSRFATYFIDVTDPFQPKLISRQQGRGEGQRDFKTYGHYAYGVADGGTNDHSLQIFDLQYLPEKVVKVYDSDVLTTSSHTCFIENGKLYLVSNTRATERHSMDILSLANPVNPKFLGTLKDSTFWRSHALFVKNDTAYLSAAWEGLAVFDVKDPANIKRISALRNYPGAGYNHSAWLSADSKKLIVTDELPEGQPVKLFDFSNPAAPLYRTSFESNRGATPHNCFIVGNDLAVVAYYKDGLQLFDISDATNIRRVGYFDTFLDNGTGYENGAWDGNWGVYPFLPSGNLIASDMKYGLFVLSNPTKKANKNFTIFPNPGANKVNFRLKNPVQHFELTMYDALGRKVKSFQKAQVLEASFDVSELAKGFYIVKATGENFNETSRFLIQK